MEVAAGIVALYAGAVATASLAWQIHAWRRSRRPVVVVEFLEGGNEDVRVAVIRAINRGEYPIRWVSAGVVLQDAPELPGDEKVIYRFNDAYEGGVDRPRLPVVVEPHDSFTTWFSWHYLQEVVDFRRPVTAFAELSTGEFIYSAPMILWGPEWEQRRAEVGEARRRLGGRGR